MNWIKINSIGNYSISENGIVINNDTNKIKKPIIDKDGYYRMTLCDKGKTKTIFIHRELARAFIENPHNLPVVDHIDRNPQNNSLSNLRWATHSMNNCNKDIISNSGERYIYIIKSGSFQTMIPSKNICKTFKTLPEAIEYRNSLIS